MKFKTSSTIIVYRFILVYLVRLGQISSSQAADSKQLEQQPPHQSARSHQQRPSPDDWRSLEPPSPLLAANDSGARMVRLARRTRLNLEADEGAASAQYDPDRTVLSRQHVILDQAANLRHQQRRQNLIESLVLQQQQSGNRIEGKLDYIECNFGSGGERARVQVNNVCAMSHT